ncbi:MAG: hypothetical protein HYV27_02405 [Candidatus Hydrogenedentes bacterium]|nr:hypothetical protein [Candidatus Hydrogenedentota bacterium]
MDMLWLDGLLNSTASPGVGPVELDPGGPPRARDREARAEAVTYQANIKELQHQVERLSLMNQAMWELIRERAGLTDADLEAKAREVDLRDGLADGRLSTIAVKCPSCMRVCNSKHHKCLYCGQLFEKPLFG